MRIVLASGSPRRRDLLAALGRGFEVRVPGVDEDTVERDPVRVAEGLALRKARAIALEAEPGDVVIGSDTVVVLDGRILGKPATPAEAQGMLVALRGRAHHVVTGVAAIAGDRVAADHTRTLVEMRHYSDEEIASYVASGSPMDKAGGYAIQDDLAPVARHDGCECGVVGLPLWLTRRLLRVVAGLGTDAPRLDRCRACPLAEPPGAGAR